MSAGGGRSVLHAIVRGRVQGVGFRRHAEHTASALGLVGWVSNRSDGAVEVHAEGPPEALRQLADWLEVGPRGARIDAVERLKAGPEAGLDGFEVR